MFSLTCICQLELYRRFIVHIRAPVLIYDTWCASVLRLQCRKHEENLWQILQSTQWSSELLQGAARQRQTLPGIHQGKCLTSLCWSFFPLNARRYLMILNVFLFPEKNEQQCCPASGHPRVHITGDSADNKVPGAFTENPAEHQRWDLAVRGSSVFCWPQSDLVLNLIFKEINQSILSNSVWAKWLL